jgi:hypothetical protein
MVHEEPVCQSGDCKKKERNEGEEEAGKEKNVNRNN